MNDDFYSEIWKRYYVGVKYWRSSVNVDPHPHFKVKGVTNRFGNMQLARRANKNTYTSNT